MLIYNTINTKTRKIIFGVVIGILNVENENSMSNRIYETRLNYRINIMKSLYTHVWLLYLLKFELPQINYK